MHRHAQTQTHVHMHTNTHSLTRTHTQLSHSLRDAQEKLSHSFPTHTTATPDSIAHECLCLHRQTASDRTSCTLTHAHAAKVALDPPM